MKEYVIGDIHGEVKRLIELLKIVGFDYENDKLYQVGDIVDRGPDSYLVVEELLKIKNLISIKGNHDYCFFESIRTGNSNVLFNQGGKETLQSYINHCNPERQIVFKMSGYVTDFDFDDFPITHHDFFRKQKPYFIDEKNRLFVHGGFNRHHDINAPVNDEQTLIWDRDLWHAARSYESMSEEIKKEFPFKIKNKFTEIFIGHTPTTYFGSSLPLKAANIWNVDTGCGKGGKLTCMDINSKDFWQV